MSGDTHAPWMRRIQELARSATSATLKPQTSEPRRRIGPDIETGPLVAGLMALGIPLLVWLALIIGQDGVRNLGVTSFGALVFVLFIWGFIYEVNRLSRLP
jgi:hypothetical protein